ncbi:hypothetical protein ACH3TN_11585 [Alistipes communis]
MGISYGYAWILSKR